MVLVGLFYKKKMIYFLYKLIYNINMENNNINTVINNTNDNDNIRIIKKFSKKSYISPVKNTDTYVCPNAPKKRKISF